MTDKKDQILLSSLFDDLNLGLVILNDLGEINYCNNFIFKCFDAEIKKQETNQKILELFLQDGEDFNLEKIKNHIANKDFNSFERCINQNGIDHFYDHSFFYCSNDIKTKNCMLVIEDATFKHSLLNEIDNKNLFLSLILENFPSAVLLKSVKDKLTYKFASKNSYQLFQFESDEIIGKNDFEIFPKFAEEIRRDDILAIEKRTALKKESVWTREPLMGEKEKKIFEVKSIKVPIFDNNSNPLYILDIIEDITDEKNRTKLIEEQREQIKNSERMSALGLLTSEISHEIKNPLTILLGKSAQLERLIEKGEWNKEDFCNITNTIKNTANRMTEIINELNKVIFSLDENISLERTNLKRLIDESIFYTQPKIEKTNIRLKVESFSDKIFVNCRPIQLSQVIINLINNAVDAIKNMTDPSITIQVENNGAWVMIKVIDSGKGIPPEILDKMMRPFFSTKKHTKSNMGLGLSICQKIVGVHRGELYVDTAMPNTTLVIKLPMSN